MLAEFLSPRPLRVEPVENLLQARFGNAGAFVLDADLDHGAGFVRTQQNVSALRGKTFRVADQIAQDLHQPSFDRHDRKPVRRGVDFKLRVVLLVASRLIEFFQRAQNRHQIDRLGDDPGQFGIQPRCIAHVADQPIEPHHVLRDDGEKLPLPRRVLDPPQRLDRAADGGERVLDLVGNVGGESFDRVHPCPQGVG